MESRNSVTHPLRIDRVRLPDCAGEIGMTICPGKVDPYPLFPGPGWDRQLDVDLDLISDQKAATVVTLLENHEFRLLKVQDLGAETERRGMAWHHLPIIDGGAPDGKFETLWLSAGKMLHAELSRGGLIVVHCRGGLGRTGTVAARLLMERGVMVEEAIRRVRAARLGAIETTEQEDYLRNLPSRVDFANIVQKLAAVAGQPPY